jgi:hypothetical protein
VYNTLAAAEKKEGAEGVKKAMVNIAERLNKGEQPWNLATKITK